MKPKILLFTFILIQLFGCKNKSEEEIITTYEIPKLTTLFSSVDKTSATMGGKIINDSTTIITDRGVTWSKSQDPDSTELVANMISAGAGYGVFYVTISGLEPNSDYFIWAYATNVAGTAYGDPMLISTEFEPDPNIPVDPSYPTIYYSLDSITLYNKRTEYAERNKYMEFTLNKFGFCAHGDVQTDSLPTADSISEAEAIDLAKDFILKNMNETGINSTDDITYEKIRECSINDTTITSHWCLTINNQTIDSIEVFETKVGLRIKNGKVVNCKGNWYPDIYIPANFNFDQEQAKSLLVGRIMTYSDFGGGAHYIKITKENFNSGNVSLVAFPKLFADLIELHILWRIYIPEVFNTLYVDVMTGEIILKEPTVLT